MDLTLALIVSFAFVAVVLMVFVGGRAYSSRAQMNRRLPTGPSASDRSGGSDNSPLAALVADRLTEDRLGVDNKLRQKLRRELLRAGFFSNDAVKTYVFVRFALVAILPASAFALLRVFAPGVSLLYASASVAGAAALAIFGPGMYLKRRQGKREADYRRIFPDFLDLVVVCISAGLSLEAAIDRVRGQLAKRCPPFGLNLDLMGAEMRAGRSSVEALNSLADRLALAEATSFVTVLRHSIELGANIGESLRIFGDEMRDKRMLRAEETANKLPVKIVVPLTVGIFPVILLIVMLPSALKLGKVFHAVS